MAYAYEQSLHTGWRLALLPDDQASDAIRTGDDLARCGAPVVDARVPGDWPLDYVRHGLLEEPFYGDNYLRLRDYESYHVYYACTFDWQRPVSNRIFLRFAGIDTVADVYLNGEKIGHAENMYIPHEFAAASLRQGKNQLLVHILPAALEARRYPIAPHYSAQKYNYESLVIRKAAHMFGWDICPRIVSSGLWRPVSIVEKKPARIEDVYLFVDALDADGTARCIATFDVDIGREDVQHYAIRLEGACGESRFCAGQRLWYVHGRLMFTLPDAKLWHVRDYGPQHRYDVTATLLKDGLPVDTMTWKQGLRTVALDYDEYVQDGKKARFHFLINGKEIFVKGTNWVPADAFHSRDAERIPGILAMAEDIGCNAMRIWGGGVYEDDAFYDWCDEHGFLIWQDFMMACALYPQTERMQRQLAEEATAVVRRLRKYACICLWAGDNECDEFCHNMTRGRLLPSTNVLTRQVLPRVLQAEDITRPYLPSSPYLSDESIRRGKAEQTPERHLWGPRDYFKGPFYHDHKAAFASEMGYHGCPSPGSLRRFIPEDKLWPARDNDMWFYHCASPEVEDSPYTYRIALMYKQIAYLFGQEPQDLDTFARMSQISQAEAKKYFIESFRSRKGERTGLIWWNLMDNWPQISDAVVDYYGTKKLAYHFIRRSQAPVCLMIDDHGGTPRIFAVNDTQQPVTISWNFADISDRDWNPDVEPDSRQATLPPDSCTLLGVVIIQDFGPHFYLMRWETADGECGMNHYATTRTLPFSYDWYTDCLRKAGMDTFEGFDQ